MSYRIKLSCLLLLLCTYSFSQFREYNYKRELTGVNETWHRVVLPDEIFRNLLPDLSDIRIFGISEKRDTIEAPYILQLASEKIAQKEVLFNLINESKNEKGYHYTFEIPVENPVNLIKLDFRRQNFDWKISLEGSHDQLEWFSILEYYRILSIKNKLTDFRFTDIEFPPSKYRYFRLTIHSTVKPEFIDAKLSLIDSMDGIFRKYAVNSMQIVNDKKNKQSVINMDLKSAVPVCQLKVFVKDTFDYYRPITVEYVTDSIDTQKGWMYNYSSLASGTLSSVRKNVFTFNSTILDKLRLVIENQDNQPLLIDSAAAEGNVYSLVCRFTEPATYFLAYGNNQANKPHYDVSYFSDMIPAHLTTLQLGDEQLSGEKPVRKTTPLFQNKLWLWAIMALIIVMLGGFSISLLKKK
jgi:hypothetical protein